MDNPIIHIIQFALFAINLFFVMLDPRNRDTFYFCVRKILRVIFAD